MDDGRTCAMETSHLVRKARAPSAERTTNRACALLRYAEGDTMKEAVEAVPYGIGWLRGLRKCVREEGVGGLKSREYRAPRERSGQPVELRGR